VDLRLVRGSGRGGRITLADVKDYVRGNGGRPAPSVGPAVPFQAAGEPPLPDFTQWGPVERVPISAIRRATAEQMARAWQFCPQVTQYDLADITELEAGRKRISAGQPPGAPKITVTVLVIKAVVAVLKALPNFNSSFDTAANELVLKKHYHVGVAVDTEHGLLVPVIRDADQKNLRELAAELGDLAERARNRRLGMEQMRGGTFTITNLGGIGGTAFSPIVNYPEVAILGLSRSSWQQVVKDGQPSLRFMMPVCLSYDHRVIDGADAARFTTRLADYLSDPMRLLAEC
jgi:pyruvate dehydrogenase E2 component (dihydrolipoamide acetyltransferase)